jgi:transcriptional regulator with XRE-family HTH domain
MGNTDKIADKIVGENIRMVRESLKMSQAKLCKAVGLSIKALSQIENGHTQVRSSNLIAIAKALGVPVKRLHAGSEESGPVDGGWNEVTPEMMDKLAKAAANAYESPLKAEIEALKAENARLKLDNENMARDLNAKYDRAADEERLLSAYRGSHEILQEYAWFFLTGVWGGIVPLEVHRQHKIESEREEILHLVPDPKSPKE